VVKVAASVSFMHRPRSLAASSDDRRLLLAHYAHAMRRCWTF